MRDSGEPSQAQQHPKQTVSAFSEFSKFFRKIEFVRLEVESLGASSAIEVQASNVFQVIQATRA
jgi:hypothetical protein